MSEARELRPTDLTQIAVRGGLLGKGQRFWATDNAEQLVTGIAEQFCCGYDGLLYVLACGQLYPQGKCFLDEQFAAREYREILKRKLTYHQAQLEQTRHALGASPDAA